MSKRRLLKRLLVCAFVVYNAPTFLAGAPTMFWRAKFSDQSSAGKPPQVFVQQVKDDGEKVDTPELEFVVIPNVPEGDLYQINVFDKNDAILKGLAVSGRPRMNPKYTVVYSPTNPQCLTLVVEGLNKEGKEEPIVVEVWNVLFAVEEVQEASRLAMR